MKNHPFSGLLDPSCSFLLLDDKFCIRDSSGLKKFGIKAHKDIFQKKIDEVFQSKDGNGALIEKLKASGSGVIERIGENRSIQFMSIKMVEDHGMLVILCDQEPVMDIESEEALRVKMSKEVSAVLKTEIAEHHNTQVELRRIKGLAQSMVNSSLDMMIAIDDRNGITEFNNAAQLKLGYSKEEVLGKDTGILYADPTQYDQVQSTLYEDGSFRGEIVNRTKNGENFVSFLSASRIIDENGEEIGSMGISRDVTQIKEAEKRSLEQAAKINAIFESSAKMMIWTLGKDFCIRSCNDNFKKMVLKGLGVSMQIGDNFGKKIEPCVPKEKFDQYKKYYSNALSGEPQEFEGVLINTKGQEVWVETFLSPIKVEGRGISEISCLAHEVTEKKLALRKLRKSLREKEVLLQEVHHRVKNNLQVISSILNLQSANIEEPKMLDMLKGSQNRIRSMSYIHESLYQNKDLSHIDLSDYVLGLARNLIHSYATDKKIELNTKLSEVQLNLDQAIPCGLLMNELITNALKYAYPKGGEGVIFIEVCEVDRKAVIRVGDSGVGMPNATDISNTPSLGLQLVATLIEQLEGSVELEQKRGTNYLITFDLIK